MASPEITDVFFRPPMLDYTAPTGNLYDFVQMGSAGAAVGAVVIQAMVMGGGRVVKGIYNWATKKVQPLYDHNGELIEFTAMQRPPLQRLLDIEDELPTPPQLATATAPQVHDDDPHNDDMHNDDLQSKIDSFIAGTRRAAHSVSIHSQSPKTPINALFQEESKDSDEQRQIDEKTKTDRDRIGKGKWEGKGERDTGENNNDNVLRQQRIQEYKNTQDRDEIWERGPWPYTPVPVTQISPNASPNRNMKYIADNIEQWARTAIQTGNFPGVQIVDGVLMDVTNMVKVEMERMKQRNGVEQSNNWTGGQGSGALGGIGMASPSTDATVESPGRWIAQLGGNGGGGSDGDPNEGDGIYQGRGGRDDRGKEFSLVNPRNINIPMFTGKSLNINPYLPFNNAIRRLILAQGADGDVLLTILDKVEKMGGATFTNEVLAELTTKYPKAGEWNRAIQAALLNWTNGIAKGLVQHNVHNGFDAWRKLYNRYIPLASDLQDLLIRELYDLKPVTESEIDGLFDEIARIKDLYIKAGPSDDLSDRWIKSAVLRNLLKDLVKNLAFELKKADTIEDIQSLITIYLHDPLTGLARGQPGPLICLASQEDNNVAVAQGDQPLAATPVKAEAAPAVLMEQQPHSKSQTQT